MPANENQKRRVLEFGADIDEETGLPIGVLGETGEPPAYPMTTAEKPIDKDAQTEVDSFIDEMGGDESKAKVLIYKMHDDSGQMAYCKRMPVASFRRAGGSEWAVSKWGPGEYQFRIILEGHRGIYRKWDMVLIGDPDDARKAAPPVSQSSDLLQGLNALANAMQTGFSSMMEAIAQTRPKERSTRELLEEMALFKNILGGDGNSGASAMMDVFMRGMELARENSSDKESNTNDLLINLAKELMPLLDKAIAADKGSAAPKLPAPAQAQQPNQPAQRQPQTEEEKMQLFFRMIISKLVKAAKKGGDALVYANVLLDDVPEQYYENLLEFLNHPNWFAEICKLNPEAQGNAAWFAELKNEVIALLSGGEDEENEGLTPPSETGKNPAGDDKPGSTEPMKGEQ